MPVDPCAKQPFVGVLAHDIPNSTSIMKLVKTGTDWKLTVCRNSGTPIYGLNASGVGYKYATSTIANVNTLMEIVLGAYDASWSYVNNVDSLNQYTGSYPAYLDMKLSAAECIRDRYKEITQKAIEFFTLGGAGPLVVYDFNSLNLIREFTKDMLYLADKQLFLPPGEYTFKNGAPANTALNNWLTADPGLVGLFAVEGVIY